MPRTVAIVGRPNVGKSTLFNRLTGRRQAIVDDQPGVTRDRREGEARLGHLSFRVIDTAGLEDSAPGTIAGRASAQTLAAVREADVILFMVDARAGVTPTDEAFANLVRRSGRPVVLLANKAEGRGGELAAAEAFSLGLGDPVAISAEHAEGIGGLIQALAPLVGEDDPDEATPGEGETGGEAGGEAEDGAPAEAALPPLRIAITGRPNAGKSTLVNRLVGGDRVLTGPEPGITRDAIEVTWEWRGRPVVLVDTAGLRRKARITDALEKLAVSDALRAVGFAEVVILVIDAGASFDAQDAQIGDLVVREGRALVIAADKWDLVEDRREKLKALKEKAEEVLPQAKGVQIVPVSGLTGYGIEALMNAVAETHRLWNARIPTAQLNRWLAAHVEAHAPPAEKGRRPRFRYMTQPKARPPTFVAFCSQPQAVPDSYLRYMVNGLRETFGLAGVPIRLSLRRTGDNPFAGKARKRP